VTLGADPGRVSVVVELLTRLASGDFAARGSSSDAEDEIDAVIVGINMLAEELEAGRDELEQRVLDRTAEFERLNHDILQLTELGNLLQACAIAEEAYAVIEYSLATMFAGLSGAMYLYRASRNLLEVKASWGDLQAPEVLTPDECWALRRGQRHFVDADTPTLSCGHVQQRTGDSICIPMSARGETVGLLHLMGHRKRSMAPGFGLTDAKQRLGVAVSEQTALSLANLQLRETLRLQALRDPMTGLFNRRFVEDWIDREVDRAEHAGETLGVMMADVDHFKEINDVYGHDAGDMLLKAIADAIRGSMRGGDVPCRYGGEEFLILIANIDAATLAARAEQLRSSVARIRLEHRGEPLRMVTVSVGIAVYPHDGKSATEVLAAADAALYSAKRAGRDRVHPATQPPVRAG
jgi:diguanylate cyclase (GGDEF)-like protein